MAAARSTFSKFTLKPSALSQHTANFNKMLEQVPVPKIDSLNLVKPLDKNVLTTSESTPNIASVKPSEENDEKATAETSGAKFVFGEQLNDRVINVASESDNGNTSGTNAADGAGSSDAAANKDESTEPKSSTTTTLWPLTSDTAANEDALEQNDANTIAKFNCKLYVLETDKVNWAERGYGIMKLIDSSDGHNCKLMMWTDKCFRLILNTKLFEKMQIDRANKKSIRFNAMDNGVIRVFLMKMVNQNDCDDLMETWESRLQLLREKSLKPSSSSSSLSNSNTIEHLTASSKSTKQSGSQPALDEAKKKIIFECVCDFHVVINSAAEDETSTAHPSFKIHLYSYSDSDKAGLQGSQKFENHQLLIDILNTESKICVTTYLKFVKIKQRTKLKSSNSLSTISTSEHNTAPKSETEFEINDVLLLGPGLASNEEQPPAAADGTTNKNVYRLVIHDKAAFAEFLTLHSKEPKFCTNVGDWSNDDSNNDDEDTSYDRGEESGNGDAADDDLNRNSQEGSSNFGQENDDDEPNRKSNSTNGSANFDSSEDNNDDSSSQLAASAKEKFLENTNSNSVMSTTEKPDSAELPLASVETNRKRKKDEPVEGDDESIGVQATKKQEIVSDSEEEDEDQDQDDEEPDEQETEQQEKQQTIPKRNVVDGENDEQSQKKPKVAEDVA